MPFEDIDLNLNFHNYNPEDIQVEETINCVFIVDESPSIRSYVKDLNFAFNDFVQTMQQSHVHDRLFVSIVTFDENVRVKSGFQPIIGVPNTQFIPQGMGTALYNAVEIGLKNAIEYRENLENTGINVKTLIFVITDGEDNSSNFGNDTSLAGRERKAAAIKQILDDMAAKESSAFSFTSILFGVGSSNSFERAKNLMGIQHLAKVGQSGAEIRKMINFISSSISKSSSGTNPIDVNF